MKLNMNFGKIAIVLICIFLCVLVISCDQEPLFWDVANEYPPIEPLIKGHPTKIVAVGTTLYVSNGNSVWVYDVTTDPLSPAWKRLDPPAVGRTIDIAAAGSALYALDNNGNLRKFDGTNWSPPLNINAVSPLVNNGKLECIFGGGVFLFAGTRTGSYESYNIKGYDILVINTGTDKIVGNRQETGKLMGVAAITGTYYLGTLGGGVFNSTGGNPAGPEPTLATNVVGITSDGTNLYIASSRRIQICSGAAFFAEISGYFSGSIAVWNHGSDKLLLVGIQYSSSTNGYGYREMNIGLGSYSLVYPGNGAVTSVNPSSQYISAIGKHVINFFYVMPDTFTPEADNDGRPIIFASTIKDGLWSYRMRNGNAQWNGEDNSGF